MDGCFRKFFEYVLNGQYVFSKWELRIMLTKIRWWLNRYHMIRKFGVFHDWILLNFSPAYFKQKRFGLLLLNKFHLTVNYCKLDKNGLIDVEGNFVDTPIFFLCIIKNKNKNIINIFKKVLIQIFAWIGTRIISKFPKMHSNLN